MVVLIQGSRFPFYHPPDELYSPSKCHIFAPAWKVVVGVSQDLPLVQVQLSYPVTLSVVHYQCRLFTSTSTNTPYD